MNRFLRFVFFSLCLCTCAWAQTPTWPFVIKNGSMIATDAQVYVIVTAVNPANKNTALLSIDALGNGSLVDVTPTTNPADYSYELSSLPVGGGGRQISVPRIESARMYISVGYPMDFHVETDVNGKVVIPDPQPFDPTDSNFYTLYDKCEFTFADNGTFLNPTAVDFFSLPLRLEQSGSNSGITASGLAGSRTSVLTQIQNTITAHDTTSNSIWNNLLVNYTDPTGNTTLLRVMSPAKAIVPGRNDLSVDFDVNYLNDATLYGFNYIDFVWNYYETNTLKIDAIELQTLFAIGDGSPDNYLFVGQVDPSTEDFVFTNVANTYTQRIAKPTDSEPFYAGGGTGGGGSFNFANNTPGAVIVRDLTSGFDVGLLPAVDDTTFNQAYFQANNGTYYTDNALLGGPAQGPWYDLYSKSMHSFGATEPIYSFAYDDELDASGTLTDPDNTSPSAAVVTLGDLTGTNIPDPYDDPTMYDVEVLIGNNSVVFYQGNQLEQNQVLNNVTSPFTVEFNLNTANIYLADGFVRPYFPNSNAILVNSTVPTSTTVTFPGTSSHQFSRTFTYETIMKSAKDGPPENNTPANIAAMRRMFNELGFEFPVPQGP